MLIFRYTCSIFDGDSKVTLTKTLFLLGDSNITTPCPLHLLEQIMAKQSIMVTHSMSIYSGDQYTRGGGEEGEGEGEAVAQNPQNGLATKRSRAIDLSRRACGAGAWALGFDSRLGPSAFFPTSDGRQGPRAMIGCRFRS